MLKRAVLRKVSTLKTISLIMHSKYQIVFQYDKLTGQRGGV